MCDFNMKETKQKRIIIMESYCTFKGTEKPHKFEVGMLFPSSKSNDLLLYFACAV